MRFLAILLTSLTAIGGLISSTLLARLVTPVMYKLLPPTIETALSGDYRLQPAAG